MFNHFLQLFFESLFFRICMCQWRFQTIRQTPSILIIFRRGSMRLMSYHHLIIVKYSRIRFKKFPMFNTNTVKIGKIWTLEKNCNNSKIWTMWFFYAVTWAATWQNQQDGCAPSEDSDQPGHPPSLISVFAVRMKKPWDLNYTLSAQRRLWSDWVA